MPIEVSKTISIDARNTLVRHRDALQQKHGVKIFFPKSLVRGDKQDMIIKGGVTGTTNAGRDIDRILVTWRQEFDAFKQRQANRRSRRNQLTEVPPHFPTIQESSTKPKSNTKTTTVNNRFAILETTDPTPEVSLPAPAPAPNTKTPVLKGWANIAAKGLVKTAPKETPTLKTPSKTNKIDRHLSVLWGDMAMLEDSDDEYYDDEVDMSCLDNWRLNDSEDFTTFDWSEAC